MLALSLNNPSSTFTSRTAVTPSDEMINSDINMDIDMVIDSIEPATIISSTSSSSLSSDASTMDEKPLSSSQVTITATEVFSDSAPDDSIDSANDSGSMAVRMAVDELRAMGETLRKANRQQQKLIEETMSQWGIPATSQ